MVEFPSFSMSVNKASLSALRFTVGWLAGLPLALTVTMPIAALAQSKPLNFPSRGVVCDKAVRICYDSGGVSAPLTRRHFGSRAERDLMRKLSGQPRPREFQFSSGEVCDIFRQTCWDDGWQRTNISNRLTRQLFISTGRNNQGNNNSGWGNNGWGNNGWNDSGPGNNWRQPNQAVGFCQLSQRGQRIFDGQCDLNQRNLDEGTAYVVDFRNGRQYNFYNRQGQLVMRDATGTWPVSYQDRGSSTLFRWGDMELSAGRSGQGPWTGGGQDPSLNPTGSLLENLIRNLFR